MFMDLPQDCWPTYARVFGKSGKKFLETYWKDQHQSHLYNMKILKRWATEKQEQILSTDFRKNNEERQNILRFIQDNYSSIQGLQFRLLLLRWKPCDILKKMMGWKNEKNRSRATVRQQLVAGVSTKAVASVEEPAKTAASNVEEPAAVKPVKTPASTQLVIIVEEPVVAEKPAKTPASARSMIIVEEPVVAENPVKTAAAAPGVANVKEPVAALKPAKRNSTTAVVVEEQSSKRAKTAANGLDLLAQAQEHLEKQKALEERRKLIEEKQRQLNLEIEQLRLQTEEEQWLQEQEQQRLEEQQQEQQRLEEQQQEQKRLEEEQKRLEEQQQEQQRQQEAEKRGKRSCTRSVKLQDFVVTTCQSSRVEAQSATFANTESLQAQERKLMKLLGCRDVFEVRGKAKAFARKLKIKLPRAASIADV